MLIECRSRTHSATELGRESGLEPQHLQHFHMCPKPLPLRSDVIELHLQFQSLRELCTVVSTPYADMTLALIHIDSRNIPAERRPYWLMVSTRVSTIAVVTHSDQILGPRGLHWWTSLALKPRVARRRWNSQIFDYRWQMTNTCPNLPSVFDCAHYSHQ